mgnify:CR=1 FL=1|tara:strand:- start:336 stop:818 length:483 start_codon:yes stop_codon:yes gene_type:complete
MNDVLVNQWKIWYHSINDNNWNNESYKLIYNIDNLLDVKTVNELMKDNHLQNAMFFIMKNDIFPTWEDPENREGSSISYKIPASNLKENWSLLLEKVIFQDYLKDKSKNSEINGISISPKKEFNIIKIWLKKYDSKFLEYLNEYPPYIIKDKMIHKKHIT